MKVLRSTLELREYGEKFSGATLKDDRLFETKDISICLRFNLKMLGPVGGKSTLVTIADWQSDPEEVGSTYGHTFIKV